MRISAPYITYEELRAREAKVSKKKWIDHKGFLACVKNHPEETAIPNYVNITPSDPPNSHKFREVKKKNWISNNGFV